MKNLYLDIGNSRTKIAVWEEPNWRIINIYDRLQTNELAGFIKDRHASYGKILISCVVKELAGMLAEVCPEEKLLFFANQDITHRESSYDSTATMGVDRFISARGAWAQNKKPAIVIDAGTACTIDYMDANAVYQGGVIMPGLKSLEDGLLTSAKALPPVSRSLPSEWPPKTTHTALQWGIMGSYLAAIDSHTNRFRTTDNQAVVWLTGGDAQLIGPLLKTNVVMDEMLIFKGLRALLLKSHS